MATAPYVINPDDPTQPTENLTMGAAAAELRGLKQRVLLAREETADLETRALTHEGANPYELDAQLNANGNKITELPTATEASDAAPLAQVLAIVGAASSGIIASVRQKWTATEGQTTFVLTLFTYVPTANNLAVYVNGLRQDVGTSYIETSSTTFTFTSGLTAGDVVQAFSNESVNANAVMLLRDDLVSTASGKGAEMVAFKQSGSGAVDRKQQNKNEESVSPEDYGSDGIDDTQALKKFFAAIATGRPGKMQPRAYRYNRATGGVLSVDCSRFSLDAQGATIICTAYPVAGASTIIDFVNIRADQLEMRGLTVDGGWQEVGAGVQGYCETGGFFNYMHGLVLSADGGFIDAVGTKNVEGLGITTAGGQGLSNVQIGKIEAHDCWMIGIDLRSLSADVEDVQVGSINARNNGTRGVGWVQVNLGDNKAAAGSRRIQIGSISANDGGGTGVGIGQYANPANGDTSGATDIYIGSIIAKGNAGHGVELYASINVHVGHINAIGNGRNGVYFERSDTNNLFSYVVGVDSISATLNGEDGVLLSGGSNYQVGAITAWNNGTTGAGFSGCKLYAANLPAQEMGHIQIGVLRCFDDRPSGSKTQDYGLSIAYFGQPFDFTTIGSADLSNNKAKDLAWLAFGNSKTVAFGELSYGSITPDHADVSRILMTERGRYVQRWRTTDATAIAPLVVKPTQGKDCITVFTATGRDAAGTVTHYAQCVDAYKWTGSGHTKMANLQTLENKTGATQAYSNDFGTAIGGYVQGLAATTMDWTVTIAFSTGLDRSFAI